jgi:hypothetical protein
VRNTSRSPIVALALVLVAALTLSLTLTACGGGGGDATKILNQTFSGGKKVRSGQLNLALTLQAQGVPQLQQPVSLKLTGPFQSQGTGTLPSFDFELALALAGRTISAGAVSTGNQGFLKLQGQSYAVPPNVFAAFKQGYIQSQQQQRTSKSPSLASFGVDPRQWIKDAKDEGDADVQGTTTTHVSAKVDVPKLLADVAQVLQKARGTVAQAQQLPGTITPQQRKSIENAIKSANFDVYSGKADHILRRLVVDLTFKVPSSAQARANGLKGGRLVFDLALGSLNQPQTVNPPTTARPFSELTGKLRTLLGGASTGATGAGGTAAPSGATGNAKAQRYLQCLQQAGGDVSKAQKCAALLNG